MFQSKDQIMKICVLKCMHLLRVASQRQNPFYGKRVVWVKWLSLTRDEGHVIPKHSHNDILSQQPCIHKIFTFYKVSYSILILTITLWGCLTQNWCGPQISEWPYVQILLTNWLDLKWWRHLFQLSKQLYHLIAPFQKLPKFIIWHLSSLG